jgi:Flp pilus assembly pilin Flp
MDLIFHLLRSFRGQRGQTMAEYGLLITVIAVIVIAAAILFGIDLAGGFQSSARGV